MWRSYDHCPNHNLLHIPHMQHKVLVAALIFGHAVWLLLIQLWYSLLFLLLHLLAHFVTAQQVVVQVAGGATCCLNHNLLRTFHVQLELYWLHIQSWLRCSVTANSAVAVAVLCVAPSAACVVAAHQMPGFFAKRPVA
jgi:hypothetical protein